MSYNATILCDSVSPAGHRVITLEVTFPRFILAEVNTHRMLTKSSASSRAIPVARRIEQISKDPFVPEAFGKNKSGMQSEELLDPTGDGRARYTWLSAARYAVTHAGSLSDIGAHKQHANRVLEPFAWHTVVFTGTEWANWDALRVSKLAQPEMYKIAGMMREVRLASSPVELGYNAWHLPYVRSLEPGDRGAEQRRIQDMGIDPVKVSVGRCAAVSYERQSSKTDMEKDAARCDGLLDNGHMAPLEHALRPMNIHELEIFGKAEYSWGGARFAPTGRVRYFLGNVEGWVQYRKQIPGEDVYVER